jgi:uncharacterized membrane protein YeaQ/YmgE (transglycosylase-associated protein family)
MNPAYGIILWIVIGALAGWLGSKIMGTDAKQGGLANVLIGVCGAVIGGIITRTLFGSDPSSHGFFASLGVALLGACLVIGVVGMIFGKKRAS